MSIEEIVDGIKDRANVDTDNVTNGIDSIFLNETISFLSDVFSTLAGILIYLILIIIPIIIMLEIIYICFPICRKVYNSAYNRTKTDGILNRTLEITFRDALRAVRDAETVKTGKSALLIYLGIKCKSIMFIVFMIGIILLGFETIVGFIGNLLSGILDIIQNAIFGVDL